MKKLVVLLAALLPISGIASPVLQNKAIQAHMNEMIGKRIDYAFQKWGYADDEKKIAGHHLLIWKSAMQFPPQKSYPTEPDTCKRILEVNKKNVVIDWNIKESGFGCMFAKY